MYARITSYKMKPGSRAGATEVMNGLRGNILGLPGMVRFINVMQDDGSGLVIALTTQETMDEETTEKVAQLWSNFAEFLEAPVERQDYHVLADWSA
ncbi:hypothetical protein [Tropicimonas sp. IMCC6043]|uniref:hypothetical protein n=1 Tax=Tropicimonas sp. IMCC6043 TaxID=2510645 RepID=UPI00101BFF8F|nr:hypothetical protein [Tropicimonas sp. IMCC6043]RYH08758.1 hypothetical protein EU800_14840 [Tropicimonas sp. IMCC6043]